MKNLLILLLFSSCQFDSKPNFNTIKSTPMKPQPIKLSVGSLYEISNQNYVLEKYTQEELHLKYLEEMQVKKKVMPMSVFLNSMPINKGKL